MKVTSVTFNHLHNRSPHDKVKAYAKIVLDNEIIITGVKVIVTDTKKFIVFPEETINPSKTRGEHVVVSLVNPITTDFRLYITNAVFERFDADPFNPINKPDQDTSLDTRINNGTDVISRLKRRLMFYIEPGDTKPTNIDTGISLEEIQNECGMDEVKSFIKDFNKKYSDATYTIIDTWKNGSPLPANLMIHVVPYQDNETKSSVPPPSIQK